MKSLTFVSLVLVFCFTSACAPATPPPSSEVIFPLNLYSDQVDANHYLLNARWGVQRLYRPDETGYYPKMHEEWIGDPSTGGPHLVLESPSGFPGPSTNQELGLDNDAFCFQDHVNWLFPVTYESYVRWDEYDWRDTDYNFWLYPKDGNGSNNADNHAIKLEFDSSETVNDMQYTWWDGFHQNVDDNEQAASAAVMDRPTIVTGLFGVDCLHDCGSEIHPVWAMTINVGPPLGMINSQLDQWSTFVRNWGFEGFCSTTDWQIRFPQNQYVVRIPWRQNATAVQVNNVDFYWKNDGGEVGLDVQVVQNDGVYLRFTLPEPDRHPLAWCDTFLYWTYTDTKTQQVPTYPTPASTSSEITAEDMFGNLLNQADASKRDAFLAIWRSMKQQHSVPRSTKGSPKFVSSTARPELKVSGGTSQVRSVPDETRIQLDRRLFDTFISMGFLTPEEVDVLKKTHQSPARALQPK